MDRDATAQAPVEIRVGVLLPRSTPLSEDLQTGDGHRAVSANLDEDLLDEELDETGHAPAWGRQGRHVAQRGSAVAQLGQDILRAAAEVVGQEIALVVRGVIGGIERQSAANGSAPSQTGSFAIDNVELKFGVKATLGAGKAVEAFFTASSEATVEVKLTLRQFGSSPVR